MSGEHKLTYLEYMASGQWAQRRAQYFYSRPKQCRACGSRRYIHLHHKTYERMGNEKDSDLAPLCDPCHAEVHRRHRQGAQSLRVATNQFIEERAKAMREADKRWKKRPCKKAAQRPRSPAGRCDPVNMALRKAMGSES